MMDKDLYSDVRSVAVIADSSESARLVAVLICQGRIPNLYFSLFEAEGNADRQPLLMQGRYHAYSVRCGKVIDSDEWRAILVLTGARNSTTY
jgi:hypothetical protein